MANRTWGRWLLTALGASVLAGAGQLGVAYGFGIVRLTGDFTDATINQWPAQLVWVGWFAMSAAVIGAVVTARLARDAGVPVSTAGHAAMAGAAALGATVVAPLGMQPARAAELTNVDPVLAVAICAILGAAVGAGAAVAVLHQPPLGWNVAAVAGGVWTTVLVSSLPALLDTGALPTVRLGVLEPTWLSADTTQRLAMLVLPLLALLAGAFSGALARWRGHLPLIGGASGVAGPVLVAFAYLTAGPGDSADRYQLAPYYGALIAVLAGALGSTAATLLRRPPTAAGHGTAIPAADPAIEPADVPRSLPTDPVSPAARVEAKPAAPQQADAPEAPLQAAIPDVPQQAIVPGVPHQAMTPSAPQQATVFDVPTPPETPHRDGPAPHAATPLDAPDETPTPTAPTQQEPAALHTPAPPAKRPRKPKASASPSPLPPTTGEGGPNDARERTDEGTAEATPPPPAASPTGHTAPEGSDAGAAGVEASPVGPEAAPTSSPSHATTPASRAATAETREAGSASHPSPASVETPLADGVPGSAWSVPAPAPPATPPAPDLAGPVPYPQRQVLPPDPRAANWDALARAARRAGPLSAAPAAVGVGNDGSGDLGGPAATGEAGGGLSRIRRGLFRRNRPGDGARAGRDKQTAEESEPLPAQDAEYVNWVAGLAGPDVGTQRKPRAPGRHHRD